MWLPFPLPRTFSDHSHCLLFDRRRSHVNGLMQTTFPPLSLTLLSWPFRVRNTPVLRLPRTTGKGEKLYFSLWRFFVIDLDFNMMGFKASSRKEILCIKERLKNEYATHVVLQYQDGCQATENHQWQFLQISSFYKSPGTNALLMPYWQDGSTLFFLFCVCYARQKEQQQILHIRE